MLKKTGDIMTKDIYTKDEIRQMICTKIDNKEKFFHSVEYYASLNESEFIYYLAICYFRGIFCEKNDKILTIIHRIHRQLLIISHCYPFAHLFEVFRQGFHQLEFKCTVYKAFVSFVYRLPHKEIYICCRFKEKLRKL